VIKTIYPSDEMKSLLEQLKTTRKIVGALVVDDPWRKYDWTSCPYCEHAAGHDTNCPVRRALDWIRKYDETEH